MNGTVNNIASKLLSAAVLCVVAAASAGPALAQTMVIHKGYVSTAPAPVRLAGTEVFTINAFAGEFTPEERTIIIEKNLNNALVASKDRTPNAVEIVTINHLPVIRLGGKHVLTIDTNLAALHGTTCEELAVRWANNLKAVLTNQEQVNRYVAQLDGDFLNDPYSPPYRRAQWEAARRNHSAMEARANLPLDLVCSNSFENGGFENMLKRSPVEAEQKFRQALTLEPGNERAHYGLGLALLKQGRVNESIGELEMARWLDHDDAEVHLALGQALESKGLDKEAMARYKEARLLQPEYPQAYLAIADLREERNDIGKSVTEMKEAAENCPQSEYIRLRRKDQLTWRLIRPY